MKNKTTISNANKLIQLQTEVKQLIKQYNYTECEKLIAKGMEENPHDPTAHNYMGILLEIQGDIINAMKHFRAAIALDSSYLPARFNINILTESKKNETLKYDIEDCPNKVETIKYKLIYDEKGIGHLVRRNKDELI
ncbi:MAG: hypothetical protein RSG07_05475 [Erysipelotrichaceae bacterium]